MNRLFDFLLETLLFFSLLSYNSPDRKNVNACLSVCLCGVQNVWNAFLSVVPFYGQISELFVPTRLLFRVIFDSGGFRAVFAKNWSNSMLAPHPRLAPLWEILDPPLFEIHFQDIHYYSAPPKLFVCF